MIAIKTKVGIIENEYFKGMTGIISGHVISEDGNFYIVKLDIPSIGMASTIMTVVFPSHEVIEND